MADIRVIIVYTDELESISIEGIDMEDISAIREKPIRDWFSASNGRDGWEGLIEEIQKVVDDKNANLSFEFQGPQESKYIFEQCIAERGYGSHADGLSREKIARKNMEEARKAEQRGFLKKAFECYGNAADYGKLPEAQYITAEYYYKCYREEFDIGGMSPQEAIERAVDYYELAAEQKYSEAQYRLFQLFWNGVGVARNQEEAVQWLVKAANNGHAEAQCELGFRYENGEVVWQSWTAAAKWYSRSAEQGYAEGQFQLGKRYDLGQGVEQNYELAYQWYKKAADQGNGKAGNNIGLLYNNGNGVIQDKKKAFEWYRRAIECGGSIQALFNLGRCYEYGRGTEQNDEKAFEWYKKAAEQGHVQAQNNVGYRYDVGLGVTEDAKLAAEWYRKSAENGNRVAQCNLGDCYKTGRGVEKDLKAMYEWYKKAAEQDYARGACNLGWCYDSGKGTEQDYGKAIQWYEKAIELGNIRALFLLGQCYEYGTGVEKNIEVAFEWYKKAADSDSPDSDACFEIAEAYYARVAPDSKFKIAGRSAALLTISVLVPFTNIVTIPTAAVGSGFLHKQKVTKAWKEFLKTEEGKDMLKYYRRAAECGHKKAKNRIDFLDKYTK